MSLPILDGDVRDGGVLHCAWCPGFVPVRGQSHGICASCSAKLLAHLPIIDAEIIPNDDDDLAPLVRCQWFARCQNFATGSVAHPVLGDVPTCDRCHHFATT